MFILSSVTICSNLCKGSVFVQVRIQQYNDSTVEI